MSPFAYLGLDDDADERSVKRAYALKLRSTRPDEDPAGFQHLNQAYKAALAAIGRRVADEADRATEPTSEDIVASDEAPTTEKVAAATLGRDAHAGGGSFYRIDPHDEPAPPQAQPMPPAIPYLDVSDERLQFDFDLFSADLFKIASAPGADLGLWLARTSAHWPLALKPTLAPHVLEWLSDEELVLPPGRFATIVAAFGLDDVLTAVDPLALDQAGRRIEETWKDHEATQHRRLLLQPGNRKALIASAKPFHSGVVVRAVAAIILSTKAERWTFLRWVPHVASHVMGVLRTIGGGEVETLSPPADPTILERWSKAERRMRHASVSNFAGLLVGLPVVFILGTGVVQDLIKRNTPAILTADQVADRKLTEITNEADGDPAAAVKDYDEFIASQPKPWSPNMTINMVVAYYNKGDALRRLGRPGAAEEVFKTLDDLFASSDVYTIRDFVSSALLSRAQIFDGMGFTQGVLTTTKTIVARYADDARFFPTIATALNIEAKALRELGKLQEAVAVCDQALDKYASYDSPATRTQAVAASLMRNELEKQIATTPPSSVP